LEDDDLEDDDFTDLDEAFLTVWAGATGCAAQAKDRKAASTAHVNK